MNYHCAEKWFDRAIAAIAIVGMTVLLAMWIYGLAGCAALAPSPAGTPGEPPPMVLAPPPKI